MIVLKVEPVAKNIVNQLKSKVPVWTGRLKNGIDYKVSKRGDTYIIYIVLEDYFVWLKNKRSSSRIPSAKDIAMSRPPLPKMNNLGVVKFSDLSARARTILSEIDVTSAMKELDLSEIEEKIRSEINI